MLNREWSLSVPVDWHPVELEVGTRLEKLNLHYMEYLEAVDDATFVAVVDDWITGNPLFRRGYWMDNWNSYALSIRCVVWMQQIATRRGGIPLDALRRMLRSLVGQLRFLMHNLERDIGGNHLIKNVKALLWAGAFFRSTAAEEWRSAGQRLLARELEEQVLPDGMHYERSPAYHAQVFADLLECRHVLPPCPVRNQLDHVLTTMAQVLADLTHPDGEVSLFNDGALHMGYLPGACLEAYTRVGGVLPDPRRVCALMDAGYFVARTGGCYVLADCGPIAPDFLPAHAHGDVLSFEWTVDCRRLVVDAGVYEYHPGEARDYSRSTRAHNTLTLDEADQAEFYSAFRVGRRPRVTVHRFEHREDGFVLEGSHDGFHRLKGRPRHHRTIEAVPRRIQVRDMVAGGAGQQARARLLLHPDCHVTLGEGGGVIERGTVRVELQTASPVVCEAARWFPDFGVSAPTRQIIIDFGAAPCSGEFTLIARGHDAPVSADGS